MKKLSINLILYAVMFLLAGLLVITVSRQSNQARMTIPQSVSFTGEYCQNGGTWKRLETENRLSAYGDTEELKSYGGYYLKEYAWAETRNGQLDRLTVF